MCRLRVDFVVAVAAVGAALLLAPASARAQVGARPVPVLPATRSTDLAALPDTQALVFPNGLRMSAAQLRELAPQKRAPRPGAPILGKPTPGPVLQVTPGSSLAQLERATPNTQLQLPDGRRITAAQLRAVDEALAKSRPARARAASSPGQVVQVPRGTPLAELLARADGDVLESPGGKRVTVGELRRYLSDAAPSPARQGTKK